MRSLFSVFFLVGQVIICAIAFCKLSSTYWDIWTGALMETYSIEYEGHVFWAVEQLARGINIYDPGTLTSEPWAVVIYNPMFIILGAAAANVFGFEFWVLRLVTIVSTCLCVSGLHFLMRRSGSGMLSALTGDVFFLGFLPVAYWSCLARVDLLGLALAVWSSERFVAAWQRTKPDGGTVRDYAAAIILITLAYFTKQQYCVFGLGWIVFLLWNKHNRLAIKLFSVCLGIVAAASLLLQLATGGYLQHITFASRLPWEWDTLRYQLHIMARDPKTAAGLIVVLIGMLYAKRLPERERLPVALLAVTLPLVLYTMGLRGAYHNHILSTICGFTWWVALAIDRLPRWTGFALAAVMLMSMHETEYVNVKISRCVRAHRGTQLWMNRLVKEQMFARPLLMEDPSFCLLYGAKPVFIDVTTFMNIWKSDYLLVDPLLRNIEEHKYPAIVINGADSARTGGLIWPRDVVQTIKLHYRQAGKFFGNGNWQVIYLPRQDPDAHAPRTARTGSG